MGALVTGVQTCALPIEIAVLRRDVEQRSEFGGEDGDERRDEDARADAEDHSRAQRGGRIGTARRLRHGALHRARQPEVEEDRKSVVSGTSVYVHIYIADTLLIQKKKKTRKMKTD